MTYIPAPTGCPWQGPSRPLPLCLPGPSQGCARTRVWGGRQARGQGGRTRGEAGPGWGCFNSIIWMPCWLPAPRGPSPRRPGVRRAQFSDFVTEAKPEATSLVAPQPLKSKPGSPRLWARVQSSWAPSPDHQPHSSLPCAVGRPLVDTLPSPGTTGDAALSPDVRTRPVGPGRVAPWVERRPVTEGSQV